MEVNKCNPFVVSKPKGLRRQPRVEVSPKPKPLPKAKPKLKLRKEFGAMGSSLGNKKIIHIFLCEGFC